LPIYITDAWADDGTNRRSGFIRGSEHMRLVCSFYISDDLLTAPLGDIENRQGSLVFFDFTHIDWRNNNIYHDFYSPIFGPDPDTGALYNWWSIWMDFGIVQWEAALYWFQIIAETHTNQFNEDLVVLPERFVRIFEG